MHSIVNRPMVVGGIIIARPMMYIALTYDHRLIDGREAVFFLRRIKEVVEDPRRLLLDIWRQIDRQTDSSSLFTILKIPIQSAPLIQYWNKRKETFYGFSFLRHPFTEFSYCGCHGWNRRAPCYHFWLDFFTALLIDCDLPLKSPHLHNISC